VFRRFITAANIFTQICFPPNISGGLETAANPSCSTFYIPLRFRRFKTAANPEKTAANFILYYLNAGYVSDGKNRRKWPKTAANGSVGSWPPQILAGKKGNSCSVNNVPTDLQKFEIETIWTWAFTSITTPNHLLDLLDRKR
jgi:hypothetical protein